MNLKHIISSLLFVLILSACGGSSEQDVFVGKWKPVEDNSRVLEFTSDGYYNLFVEGMNIFQDIEGYGRIKYQIESEDGKLKLFLKDEALTKDFVTGEIEKVSDNKIAIAFYQQNGEISVKEVYARVIEEEQN